PGGRLSGQVRDEGIRTIAVARCRLEGHRGPRGSSRCAGGDLVTTTQQAATDFPVPPDLDGFWSWDKMHGPRPMTPMSQEITFVLAIDGFTRAMHEFSAPVGFHARVINYYGYMTVKPLDVGDE